MLSDPALLKPSAAPALLTQPLPAHPSASEDVSPSSPTIFPPSSSRSIHPSPARSPAPHITPEESSTRPRIADRWANGPLIGLKPAAHGKDHPNNISPLPTPTRGTFGKIALPGLSETPAPLSRGTNELEDHVPTSSEITKEPPQVIPQQEKNGERKSSTEKPHPRRPPVPHRPSRIPSTGSRATVMDVAQVWSEHKKQGSQDMSSPRPASPNGLIEPRVTQPTETPPGLGRQRIPEKERPGQERPGMDVEVTELDTQIITPTSSTAVSPKEEKNASLGLPDLLNPTEKSKSSWEKYSEFIMPALEEEWTPVPSPIPTMNKPPETAVEKKEKHIVTAPESMQSKVDYLPVDLLSTTLNSERRTIKVFPADLITFGEIIKPSFISVLIFSSRFPELC